MLLISTIWLNWIEFYFWKKKDEFKYHLNNLAVCLKVFRLFFILMRLGFYETHYEDLVLAFSNLDDSYSIKAQDDWGFDVRDAALMIVFLWNPNSLANLLGTPF